MGIQVIVKMEPGRLPGGERIALFDLRTEVANFRTDNEFAGAPKNASLIEQKAMELKQLIRQAGVMDRIDSVELYYD